MTKEDKLNELRDRVNQLALSEEDNPKGLETAIRCNIRSAKADPMMAIRFRLLLARLFYWKNEPVKARSHYKKALEQDSDCVEAMIGIASTYSKTSRYNNAKDWLQAAYQKALDKQNYSEQMNSLHALAFNAEFRSDTGTVSRILDMMCHVLLLAPQMDSPHTLIAELLINNGRGEVALSYLECLIKHMLNRKYPRAAQYLALHPFLQIKRLAGYSDEEISGILDKFRPMAANKTVARDFNLAIEQAFRRGHLHYIK